MPTCAMPAAGGAGWPDSAVISSVCWGERDRPLRVTAQMRKEGASERDRRGDVGQQAGGLTDRRLEGLGGSSREDALGGSQRRLGCVHVACDQRHERLRKAQPWAGSAQLNGERRKPPPDRRVLTRQEQPVEVLFDQPRRPDGIPSSQRMPYCVVGQPMRL
jgi:hypothetical protein